MCSLFTLVNNSQSQPIARGRCWAPFQATYGRPASITRNFRRQCWFVTLRCQREGSSAGMHGPDTSSGKCAISLANTRPMPPWRSWRIATKACRRRGNSPIVGHIARLCLYVFVSYVNVAWNKFTIIRNNPVHFIYFMGVNTYVKRTGSRIMDWGATNERRRYIVMSSLFGWAHTQNDPCRLKIEKH